MKFPATLVQVAEKPNQPNREIFESGSHTCGKLQHGSVHDDMLLAPGDAYSFFLWTFGQQRIRVCVPRKGRNKLTDHRLSLYSSISTHTKTDCWINLQFSDTFPVSVKTDTR